MKKVSLTLKITLSFVIILNTTLFSLYYVFYNMAYERMLESEKEKAVLMAQTIEPMIGVNYYLGLINEIRSISENMEAHPIIASIKVAIEDKEIYVSKNQKSQETIIVAYPIKHPVSSEIIGYVNLDYKLENFYQLIEDIKSKIITYLALLGIVFFIFALLTQRLLRPLGEIASKVKDYKVGEKIDFSSIRMEVETNLIVEAFEKMIGNIKEHTVMLERYKYAVDESAIVSKADLNGVITYVNDEFSKISGYSRDELIGQTHKIIRHPDMSSETFKNLWDAIKKRQTWKGVIKNKRKDGSSYYVKSVIVPIFDENVNTVEYIGIRHDITQIIEQQEQIVRHTTDILTGLPNKTQLEEDIKSVKSPKLAIMELDDFHVIQDYYGHEIGEKAIKNISDMLASSVKDANVSIYKINVALFGFMADENVSAASFNSFCKNTLLEISNHIVEVSDESFSVQATAGSTYTRHNTFANAMLALHHARDVQKDFIAYEDTDNIIEYYENNLKWTKEIKNALVENRIAVFVQAIFDASSLAENKYECLVRIIAKDGTIVSPFLFLDIAKKSKLYLQITKRVIEISFDVFSKLPENTFSINLSVEDLMQKDSMDFLKSKIKEYDIASRLTLEIVESEGIENFDEIITVISDLKALGCKLSIDDFGTGYSNFAYLMQLNVDYIKIDGSLIKDIDHNRHSQIISKSILDFAKQLELKTVAEYVHNESVMKYVQDIGVDYLQGFHLGEPRQIETLL